MYAKIKKWFQQRAVPLLYICCVMSVLFTLHVLTEIDGLRSEVTDLKGLVTVEHNDRMKKTEIILDDIERSLMPNLSEAKQELQKIGDGMQELKGILQAGGRRE